MSIQIVFTSISFIREIEVQHQQSHLFQLEILSKQFRQNMKTNFHAINKSFIDLPQHIFILPSNDQMIIRVQQRNDKNQIDKVLSFAEFKFVLNQLQVSKIKSNKIQQNFIQFLTFNKNFKIKIIYKALYENNKIFNGHFNGILKNQGYHALSLIPTKQFHHYNYNYQAPIREFQNQAEVIKSGIKTKNNFKQKFTNCLHLCKQVELDSDSQIAQQQLPKQFKSQLKHKFGTPLNTKLMTQKNQKLQIENSTKQKINNSLQNQKDEQKSSQFLKPLYVGSCKSKNLFSCFDEHVQEQQICIIQPVYKR